MKVRNLGNSRRSPAAFALVMLATACTSREEIVAEPGRQPIVDGPTDASQMDRAVSVPDANDPGACPQAAGLPGPEMVRVPTLRGTMYCIDSTEVTQAHYFEFLKAKGAAVEGVPQGDLGGQPEQCKYNNFYTPSHLVAQYGCRPEDNTDEAYDRNGLHPDFPVACVDWCDAHMYCSWAGKRLCGRVGGGSAVDTPTADASQSEWFNACTQGGKTAFAYGSAYDPEKCPASTAVSKAPECHGTISPFDRVFGLGGRMGEWTELSIVLNDLQYFYAYVPNDTLPEADVHSCASGLINSHALQVPNVGFRCCLD